MKAFFRLLGGLALLPAAWGCAWALGDVIRAMPVPENAIFPPTAAAFLVGLVVFLAAWFLFPRPIRLYVLGHELTHALWGLMFGSKVRDLKVRANGGSVKLSKSNFLITLAPYFFPLYTIVVVLVALVVGCIFKPLPWPWFWTFLVGFTWCFHCCFTLDSLLQRQPDILEYGRLLSWTVILIFNVLGVIAWLTVTVPIPVRLAGRAVELRVAQSYVGGCSWVADRFWQVVECCRR